MTPEQPKEAAKWSAERLNFDGKVYPFDNALWCAYIKSSDGTVLARIEFNSKQEAETIPPRFVAAVNFCARLSTEFLTEPKRVLADWDIISELTTLRAELKDTLALLKASEKGGWDDDSSLERWFPFTAEELKKLRQQTADLKTQVDADAVSTKADCEKIKSAVVSANESVKGIIQQRDDLQQKLQQTKTHLKEFDIRHADGTTEEVKVSCTKDPHTGEDLLTGEACYQIDFLKAKRRMEIAEQKLQKAEEENGRLIASMEKKEEMKVKQ